MKFIWSSNNKTLRENVTFRPLFDSQDENKYCKTSLKLHKAYQIIFYSIICLLLKCRLSSSDKFYMTENVIVRPSYDPKGPHRAKKSYCTSSWHPNYILEDTRLDFYTSENVVQVTYFTEKRKQCLSTLIWWLWIKRRFRNLIAHLKDLPYHTL